MGQNAKLQKKIDQIQVDQEVASLFFCTELSVIGTQTAQRQTDISLRMSPGTSYITKLMLCMPGSLYLYYFFPPKSESSCPNHVLILQQVAKSLFLITSTFDIQRWSLSSPREVIRGSIKERLNWEFNLKFLDCLHPPFLRKAGIYAN